MAVFAGVSPIAVEKAFSSQGYRHPDKPPCHVVAHIQSPLTFGSQSAYSCPAPHRQKFEYVYNTCVFITARIRYPNLNKFCAQ